MLIKNSVVFDINTAQVTADIAAADGISNTHESASCQSALSLERLAFDGAKNHAEVVVLTCPSTEPRMDDHGKDSDVASVMSKGHILRTQSDSALDINRSSKSIQTQSLTSLNASSSFVHPDSGRAKKCIDGNTCAGICF